MRFNFPKHRRFLNRSNLCLAVLAAGLQAGVAAATTITAIPNEYVVFMESNSRVADDLKPTVFSQGGTIAQEWSNELLAVHVKGIDSSEAADLLAVPGVTHVSPNYQYEEESELAVYTPATLSGTPNHLLRISKRNYPLPSSYVADNQGDGVNVYVIDSGLNDAHPELLRTTKVPTVGNVYDGCGTGCSSSPLPDCSFNSHGTHVAALIGGNNVGVAPRAHVWGLRITTNCGGDTSTLASRIGAFNWLLGQDVEPGIVNMSLGMGGWDATTYDPYFNALATKGMLIIGAAGNTTNYSCNTYAGNNVNIKTIAATTISPATQNDPIWALSTAGPCVEMAAPGASILSANNNVAQPYQELSGTSQAAAIVSGVAALVWRRSPWLSATGVWSEIDTKATKCTLALTNSAPNSNQLGTPNKFIFTGSVNQSPLPVCSPL